MIQRTKAEPRLNGTKLHPEGIYYLFSPTVCRLLSFSVYNTVKENTFKKKYIFYCLLYEFRKRGTAIERT